MNENKFVTVFEKINLSKELKSKFDNTEVSSMIIDKENKKLNIELLVLKIISISSIRNLEKELLKEFPFIDEVNVTAKFTFEEKNMTSAIKTIWPNIVFLIKEKSPFCYEIIETATYKIEGNILFINVKNNSSSIFISKKINELIESYLNNFFNITVKVNFKNIIITLEEKNKYNDDFLIRETELINDIPKSQTRGETFKPKQEFNNFKKFTGKRTSLKINPALRTEFDNGDFINLSESLQSGNEILIRGKIFDFERREIKSGNYLIIFDVTDGTDSITIKFFIKPDKYTNEIKELVKKGNHIIVKGNIQDDEFSKELTIMAKEIFHFTPKDLRVDNEKDKRVELHLHTQMSSMDGISSAEDLINQAIKWNHKAIAITDHGVVQAFPEAMKTAIDSDIKIIYGVEAYLIDDLGVVVECPNYQTFEDEFVVFDLETTGLKKEIDKIIEIGAVKISNGKIIDTFSSFIDTETRLSAKIIEITNITDNMLIGAPKIQEVLPKFLDFSEGSVLVAHNAGFDMGFIRFAAAELNINVNNTVIDTVELSRTLLPELNRHKLNLVAKHLNISLENHHRAKDDAEATAQIFFKFVDMLKNENVKNLNEINLLASKKIDKKNLRPTHAVILVKNKIGLRNLYELISNSHINHFYRRPRIPKSEFINMREGLLIGTACEAGEFYKAVFDKKSPEFIRELAEFYDYFEIQPTGNNMFMLRNGTVNNVKELENINKKIVDLGEKYKKLVVATCDVHFLNPEDDIYRKIIMYGEGFKDADMQAPLYFRTTEEMLNEFSYLGDEKAKEVVITNTNKIADMIEKIKPIPSETFPPHIEGSDKLVKEISIEKAKSIYGNPLPEIVSERLNRELDSIIKNGFSVMYIIAQKLVWKSLEDGYLVGSRGSVGSSFAATMLGVTEVNPLIPHYYCPSCQYSDFEVAKSISVGSGCDLPDKNCPVCNLPLKKDGHDIPFETFLGFDGDKEPDIDLNFSSEYQWKAHAYTEELFGRDFVFKAGTIGTIAEKTAYGFVRKYYDEKELFGRNAEINRLRNGCTGIKRTTGQHPGGLMIVPNDHSIYEFTPIQRPANDSKSDIVTTHFDYHSLSGRLLKLDILGHDAPTIIRYLHDTTGVDPVTVDIGDKKVISLFTSPEALGVGAEDIKCSTGSLGLPEFGTPFVRQMLMDTKPSSFSELARISGLSHGTDVWINNAQSLIKDGVATLKEIIPTRDDIMVYLISMGVEKKSAFQIMERVRKGNGLKPEEETLMVKLNIPRWYIDSCKKIKYMFPKGHAVAYVMMTVRIGYFKIYYPYSFYGATFSVKVEDFDYESMCHGIEKVSDEIKKINSLGIEATAKDKSKLTILELVYEMYARGLKFLPLDLYKSEADKFLVTQEGLLPPLSSVQGLGTNAAQGIIKARAEGEFSTIEEFTERTKTSKTVTALLKELNIFKELPETDQLSLF